MNNAVKKFFNGIEPKKIFTYEEFTDFAVQKVEKTNIDELSENELIYFNYSKINLQRVNRIQKTFKPNAELLELFGKINSKQTWLVITEDWCGDSAQNLPYIYSYIKDNPNVEMLIILRDTNLEVIDSYFTEGNPRSIPKIIVFDQNEEELFIWGPRPKFAQDLVQQLKAEGYSKEEFNKELHLWYGRNRGVELSKEFITILRDIHSIA
ncbi:MAG: thioredoxin family protein [Melioribacteraceae bacterium]|nr:thioredoxin family protein [Melioribacteraceae bacterium]